MKTQHDITIVEDNETMREGMVRVAEKLGHRVAAFDAAESALSHIKTTKSDLFITDYKLPGMNGIDLTEKIRSVNPDALVLIITAYGTVELAVEAIQKGAADFLPKPFSPEELTIKIQQLTQRQQERMEAQRLTEENSLLKEDVELTFNYGEIIGQSPVMQAVYQTIDKVAKGDSSVIIYGESGTGKELVARAIHKASARKERAFIRVNCGALAEGVLESELFGHERGAFTGAMKRKKGRFELADRGTIFLDEIGDVPLATQVKLLRVLQESEFERVGGEETLSVDVRIIAATNKNLNEEIKKGSFREDLYYRLHVIPIELPPLRQRLADIPLLTSHFVKKISHELKLKNLRITDDAQTKLCQYDWPGNIRELENVIERAAVLCSDKTVTPNDLPLATTEDTNWQPNTDDMNLNRSLESMEKHLLQTAMQKTGGVKTAAAKMLGIKTSALYYKLEKYNLL